MGNKTDEPRFVHTYNIDPPFAKYQTQMLNVWYITYIWLIFIANPWDWDILPTFAIKIQPDVGRYTIHWAFGKGFPLFITGLVKVAQGFSFQFGVWEFVRCVDFLQGVLNM